MTRSWFARAAGQLASGLDQAFNGLVLGNAEPKLAHAERMAALELVAAFYDRGGLEPQLFAPPPAIEPALSRLRRLPDGGELLELRWDSGFEPLWSEPALEACLAEVEAAGDDERSARLCATAQRFAGLGSFAQRYHAVIENRAAHARWFRHGGAPRPCAVLLHGYASGTLALEARIWPVMQLYARGFDVVQTVLPFHGTRRDPRRGLRPPAFPVAGDVRLGIEGMRQLVREHVALFDHLARQGTPGLGAMGMSFGGYAVALLATLDARLRFATLVVPLAQLEPRAWSTPDPSAARALERSALRRAQRSVSPFSRPSLLPAGSSVVIAGELDRVTGIAQAQALAEHLHAELYRFQGGHLLQLGRGRAFERVLEQLDRTCPR